MNRLLGLRPRAGRSLLAVLAALCALTAAPALAQQKAAIAPLPASRSDDPDPAYSAFQRGQYLTAFHEATRRVEASNDPKSMTLLGELYADGLGVVNDDNKAAEWYRLAAARGDREAMFALAMFRMTGRAGPIDRKEGGRLLTEAAKLGHVVANYNLALLYLEGQVFPQDFARAAELMRVSADAGNPQAQYALATFYKDGRGVKQDAGEAARLLAEAARTGLVEAEVEYAIALFNGTGVARNETAAFNLLSKAAQKGSAPAQKRLALTYATGRGVKSDPVEAGRWYLIARAGGDSDIALEDFLRKMSPTDRAAAEAKAKPWISHMSVAGRQPQAGGPADPAFGVPNPAKP